MIQPSASLVQNVLLPFLEQDTRPIFILDLDAPARMLYSNHAVEQLEQRYTVSFARECFHRLRVSSSKSIGGVLASDTLRHLALSVPGIKFTVRLQGMPEMGNNPGKLLWVGVVEQISQGPFTPSGSEPSSLDVDSPIENVGVRRKSDASAGAGKLNQTAADLKQTRLDAIVDVPSPGSAAAPLEQKSAGTELTKLKLDALNTAFEEPAPCLDWTRKWENIPPGIDVDHYNLLHSVKWEETEMGPISSWSESLRANVTIAMFMKSPFAIYWGDQGINIYNEAWRAIAQERHPKLMGLTVQEGWPDAYDYYMPVFAKLKQGEVVQEESTLFMLNRSVEGEETYMSFTSIPTIDNNGHYQGALIQAIVTSDEVLYARRSSVIMQFQEKSALIRDLEDGVYAWSGYWAGVLEALDENPLDSPFVVLYSVDDRNVCKYVGSRGVSPVFADYELNLDEIVETTNEMPLPFIFLDSMRACRDNQVMTQKTFTQDDLQRLADMPYRGFKACNTAMVSPIISHDNKLRAVLILGLNHRRPLDKNYRQWLLQVNSHISAPVGKYVYLQSEVERLMETERVQLQLQQRDQLQTSLNESIQELRKSEFRFSATAANIPIGLVLLDPTGFVTWANDAWYTICGLGKDKDPNTWDTIVYEEDRQHVIDLMTALINGGPAIIEHEFRCGNNTGSNVIRAWDKWCRCNIEASVDSVTGETWGLFAILVDITSIKMAEEYQRQLTIEAVETRRQMNNYIDVTSHELRNPLSAVLQSADEIQYLVEQMYAKKEVPSRIQQIVEAADTIIACADHQKKIIDDILNVSKLDSGLMLVDPIPSQISHVLKRALKMFKPELKSKEITSSFKVTDYYTEHCEESWFILDPARITQVFINLITNAIKFTSQKAGLREINVLLDASSSKPDVRDNFSTVTAVGSPSHAAATGNGEESDGLSSSSESDTWYLHIHVQDTGIGITKEWQQTMGQRFQQAPKTHQQYGGSGLGLFIARKLANLLGGELHFESEHRVGSIFSFYVKAPKCPAPPNSTIVVPEQVQDVTRTLGQAELVRDRTTESTNKVDDLKHDRRAKVKYDVLVVEDNRINQQILKKQLESHGCTTSVANDGQEALQILGARIDRPFTVVLMDQEMPVMDGVTAVAAIRQMEASAVPPRHLPIIGTSANARYEQIDYMINAGMDDVITKPFLIKTLMVKIEQVLLKMSKPPIRQASLSEPLVGNDAEIAEYIKSLCP